MRPETGRANRVGVLPGGRHTAHLLLALALVLPASTLPAATVTNCDEASLRAAISGGGLVTFGCDGSITLTAPIAIAANVTIDGSGHQVIITATGTTGLFVVQANRQLDLLSLTLSNGTSLVGGAVWNEAGTVRATNCYFVGNRAAGVHSTAGGGAIFNNSGSLNVVRCIFSGNRAYIASPGTAGAGGVRGPGGSGGPGWPANGGAIWNSGVALIHESYFIGNSCSGGAGGDGGPGDGGPAAEGWPGGPGGVGGDGAGGAVFHATSTMRVSSCTFANNSAAGGVGGNGGRGAFFSGGGGTGGVGGMGSGAGIHAATGTVLATNNTWFRNSAAGGRGGTGGDGNDGCSPDGEGGRGGDAFGGAIFASGASVICSHNTLAQNAINVGPGGAGGPGQFCNGGPRAPGPGGASGMGQGGGITSLSNPLALTATIFAFNGPGDNFHGLFSDNGFNISSSATPGLTNQGWNNLDPKLLSLADNGGPTPTIALQPDSPAIDHFTPSSGPATDQRGVSRINGFACDAGAYELEQPPGPTGCDAEAFRASVSAGGLVVPVCDGVYAFTVPLVISNDTTIDGSGKSIVLTGGRGTGVIYVKSGVTLNLLHVTIRHGFSTNGAGICNDGGIVRLIGCTVASNRVVAIGGSNGTNGLGAPNTAQRGGTGGNGTPGAPGEGGAVFNAGTLLVTNTIIIGNIAEGGAGGAGGSGGRGAAAIDMFGRCIQEGPGGEGGAGAPGGQANGGAICNKGTAILDTVTIRDNRVLGGAGGAGGRAGGGGCGCSCGGGHGSPAAGSAGQGGGIFNEGFLQLSAVSLFGNAAQGGAGGNGYAGTTTPGATGGPSVGGAIANLGTNTMVNATLALNRSIGGPGGLGGNGTGGDGFAAGLFNAGKFSATNCTIWVNESVGGFAAAGFAASIQNTGGVVILVNSIVGNLASSSNCLGAITDLGHNICSDASAAFTATASLNNIDPRLGPLVDNGGPTRTISLESGSPAVDAADNAQCPPTDQRGVSRPVGVACDIGAFEGSDGVLYPTFVQSFTPSLIVGGSPSTLQFSLSNVSSRTLSNITFTNRLPSQVTVATDPTVRTDCSGTVLATGGTISVFGMNLLPHQGCSIQVDVTSLLSGIYTNMVGPVVSTEAGESPASAISILVVETPPSAITGMPSGRTGTSTILNGLVNPNGVSTTVYFEFGLTTNYGNQTPLQALGNGRGFVAVSNSIAGLAPATGYHFRIVAMSPLGTSFGKDQYLLTGGLAPEALVNLDGADDYLTTPDLRNFFTNETVTIEVWFRAKRGGVIVQDKGQPPPGNGNWFYWAIEVLSSGEVMLRVGGVQSAVSLGKADFESWHHAVLRYDKEALNLDGFLDGAEAVTDAHGDRDAPWEVGHGQYYAFGLGDWPFLPFVGFFQGDLAEVRIWNVARTAEEIRTNLSRRLSGSEPGLVCYWRLDEGVGTNANDASGHGNNGIVANGVLWFPSVPSVMTGFAGQISSASAVLDGIAFASGAETAAWFQFGPTTNYGNRTSSRNIGTRTDGVAFSIRATDLLPLTTYHYRAAAANRLGTNYGIDSTFFTLSPAPGVSASLDGVNDFILTPDLKSFFSNETVTIELWFNALAAGVLIDERGQSPSTPGWQDSQMEILPSGAVKVRVWNLPAVPLGGVAFDSWHHAALRYDKGQSRLDGFLDGVASAHGFNGDRMAPWESELAQIYGFGLGDSTHIGSGAHFRGRLDEIRIWNTARTADQIATNMFRRLTGTEPGLVCYWRLDDGVGLTAIDSSGRGNVGTLNNGVEWIIGPSPIGSLLGVKPILGIRQLSDGRVQLDSTGLDGTSYVLEVTSNLSSWFAVATNRATGNGYLQFIDAGSLSSPQRFYRLRAP